MRDVHVRRHSRRQHLMQPQIRRPQNLADVRLLSRLKAAGYSSESVNVFSEFLSSLPSPSEVPRIERNQLSRLYLGFVRGEIDESLLDEVESRLIARLEVYLSLYRAWYSWADQEEEDAEGADAWWTLHKESPMDTLHRRYGLEITGQPASFIENPHHRLLTARQSGEYKSRVLAIDAVIQLVHDNGPLARSFVEGGSEFLDWLNAQMTWRV